MDKKLIDAIETNSLVLFVGAGMSIPLGFPSWNGLIINILEKLQSSYDESTSFKFSHYLKQSKNLDVLEVLHELERVGLKSQTKKILNEEIKNVKLTGQPFEKHKKLWSISQRIITTNYDQILEKVKPDEIVAYSNNNVFQQSKSIEGNPYLYKIHGDIDNPDTCILFPSDYEELYSSSNPNQETLRTFFLNKTLLFLGFSLDDPFLINQLEFISELYRGYQKDHFIALTGMTDKFLKYNVNSINVQNWDQGFDEFLDSLMKKEQDLSHETKDLTQDQEDVDISTIDDLDLLQRIGRQKLEDFDKENKIQKSKISKDLIKVKHRIIEIQTKKAEFDFGLTIPHKEEAELEYLFESIFNSEKLTAQDIQLIDKVRNQSSSDYKYYHRSVLVSALACSLINFKKVDPRKISYLIDFTNDNEEKVWQKSITYLFLTLNHLGNKWLRFPGLIKKLERLKTHQIIQSALSEIIVLIQLDLLDISPIDKKIFENEYFAENPYNYFLPFYENNPSIDLLYDNEDIKDVSAYIESLHSLPFTDSMKYLICNNVEQKERDERPSTDEDNNFDYFRNLIIMHRQFEPYLKYTNEFLSFYEHYPKAEAAPKKNIELITVNNFKKHLLNSLEHRRALARQFAIKKDWGNAIVNYEALLKIDKNDTSALINMANCMDNADKNEDDILKVRLNIENLIPQDVENLTQIASIWHGKEKYKKALDYWDKVINRDNNNATLFFNRGTTLIRLERYNEAIKDLSKSIELDNKLDYRQFYHRGVAKWNSEDSQGALKDFDMAIELDVEIDGNSRYLGRGRVKRELNDLDGGIDDLNMALKIDSKDSSVYNELALIYRMQGLFTDAFECVKKGLKHDGNNALLYGTNAIIYSSIGDKLKFYEYLEKAFELGGEIVNLQPEFLEKHGHENEFKSLLKKYKQKLPANK